MSESVVRVGLLGLGTIGTGVVRLLRTHASLIDARLGFPLRLERIADIDLERDRGIPLDDYRLSHDWSEVVAAPEVDLVVELIGGSGVAREAVLAALDAGKSVVTANKALLALHGAELFERAAQRRVDIGFEASVGGTIPVLRALREGLCADQLESQRGIVNGTCNYILTRMEARGEPYEVCLKQAQELGFAEADPAADVSGADSTHKLTLLLGLAFGVLVEPARIPTEGIEHIRPLDIEYAERSGFRIKLLATARRREGEIEASVRPTMIPARSLLGQVEGSMNAVEVRGCMSGPTLYYGAGAGPLPTASAVVADLMELARARRAGVRQRVPPLGTPTLARVVLRRQEDLEGEYYLRFTALDRPGVLSRISGALGERGVSMASVLQLERSEAEAVPVVMMTHPAKDSALRAALAEIDRLGDVTAATQVIPLEREI